MRIYILLFFIYCSLAGHSQQQYYQNPISDSIYAADPSVLFHDGLYYLYATSADDGFKYWISSNLVDWEGMESMKARSNEGMTVFKKYGRYYMTYSGNHYADSNYGVGYATSKEPLGMWVKYPDNPILKQDLSIGVSGPGHNNIIQSPDQTEWFMIYHSHADTANPSGKRILNIDRMVFNEDSTLSVMGPTRTPQPIPSSDL